MFQVFILDHGKPRVNHGQVRQLPRESFFSKRIAVSPEILMVFWKEIRIPGKNKKTCPLECRYLDVRGQVEKADKQVVPSAFSAGLLYTGWIKNLANRRATLRTLGFQAKVPGPGFEGTLFLGGFKGNQRKQLFGKAPQKNTHPFLIISCLGMPVMLTDFFSSALPLFMGHFGRKNKVHWGPINQGSPLA